MMCSTNRFFLCLIVFGFYEDTSEAKLSPRTLQATPLPVEPDNSTTTTDDPRIVNCPLSVTFHNWKRACKSSLIFSDDFESFDANLWRHEVKIATKPDYEFTLYDSKPENTYIKDGVLHIQPSVYNESFVENGQIALDGCTGDAFNGECYGSTDYMILPPIQSARITTRQKFSFKYGIVEIQAKLPVGDWIVSEIWLMPADNAYGAYYESGKIRFYSRGNSNLKYMNGREMGCETLEGSVMVGYGQNINTKSVYFSHAGGWRDEFHNLTIIWSPDDIAFLVDGKQRQSIMQNARGLRLVDHIGFSSSEIKIWNTGSSIAPFDQPFYLCLGISVGGIRDFEDGAKNNGEAKPWANTDPKAMLKFWKNRTKWKPTWQKDTSLAIKSIRIRAL